MSPAIKTPLRRIWYAVNHKPVESQRTLILIHGAGGSHLSWPPQLRAIDGWNVLAPDLPGHGRSEGPGCDSIDGYAAAMTGLFDTLGIEKVVLCGYSMGGAVALWMALNHPDKVDRLILMSTGANLPVAPAILNGLATDRENTLSLITHWSFGPNAVQHLRQLTLDMMRKTGPEAIQCDFNACNEFDVRDRLGEIQAPTLVICGTADKMTPLKYSQFLADQIPQASLITIEDGGHMMALEQPDAVSKVVLNFLNTGLL